MRTLKLATLLSLTSLVSACASTSNYTPEPLTLESNDVFEFNDSKSFALNVAEMTNKTRGLRDVEVPENAQHRISGAEKGLAAYVGIFGGGFSTLGMGLTYSGAIGARNWRPMYVFTDLDADLAGHENLTSKVERLVDAKFNEAFSSNELDGFEYVGLARSPRRHSNNYFILYTGSKCHEVLARVNNPNGIPQMYADTGVYGPIELKQPTCIMAIDIQTPQLVRYENGEKSIVIVAEQHSVYSTVTGLSRVLNGYSVVPEKYLDLDGTQYTHAMPFVTYNQHLYVFSMEFDPIPLLQ